MTAQRPHPPRLPDRFLQWFCADEVLETLQGDLYELYDKRREKSGKLLADVMYWVDVASACRPFAFKRSTRSNSNYKGMFQHVLLISLRGFIRYKASFVINLAGLSTGIACALLIYLWVTAELGIDKFHRNDDRLYQVWKTSPNADGSVTTRFSTPVQMAQTMVEDLPEVEKAVAVVAWDMKGVISAGDKRIKAVHQFAGNDYFGVFSFNLLEGNSEHVLTDKSGVLLSDELARKLFNTTENLIGKTIEWEWWDKFNGSYIIAGIFEAPPANSSKQFDLIFSLDLWMDRNENHCWCNNNAHTYVVLKEGTDIGRFNEKILDYSKLKYRQFEGSDSEWEGTLLAQKYSKGYLYGTFENGVQVGGKIEYVRLFTIIGIFILAIACINFMNLSTARASRRAKEVGIKKAVGVSKRALIFQYLGESVLLTLFSFLAAVLLVVLALPSFESVAGKQIGAAISVREVLYLAAFILAVGVVAGSYPALYLSRFKPVLVLKGQLKTSAGERWVRRGMVVFQFAVSVLLIVSVVVVYKQMAFIQSKNLGYDKENIIRIENEGELRKDAATFVNEVQKLPGVVSASTMSGDLVGNHSGTGGVEWEGKKEGISFSGLYVDYGLTEMLGFEMAQGRSFSREFGTDADAVLFNETAISMMGLENPVGKIVKFWGQEKKIVGVVKDFHYESLYEHIGPLYFLFQNRNNYSVIKLMAGSEPETLAQIEEFYEAYNKGMPFDYHFLDHDYQKLYAAENRLAVLSQYFSGIAILISCLGLFGLATFTAERRQKEIGIRKVLGSGVFNIVKLLSGEFARMVLLAIVLALPLSYLAAREWLDSFAYRTELQWCFFAAAGLVALAIACLTVSVQTLKAARLNPVKSLRSE